jgi:hypothetical protein
VRPATARSMARPTAGGSGHQHDPVAFAVHFQDAVSVFLAEVDDVGAGGFEDPQAEQPEHGDQGEVVRVARLAGGCEHGLELQVGQPECGRLGWHVGSADISAGEVGSTPSMTQVRKKPATIEIRRDTVEGLNRHTSCIQRM